MTRFFTTITMLALAAATLAFSQELRQSDVAEMYSRHAGELIDPILGLQHAKATSARSTAPTATPTPVPYYPSDGAKLVTLRLSKMFPQTGERLIASLVGLSKVGAFQVTGRHTVYDESTKTPSASFFAPKVCGFSGYCPGGIEVWQSLEVYSTQISDSDMVGDHALDFSLFDNGKLIQQIFVYFYVGRPSVFGRMYERLDSAKLVSAQGVAVTVELSGQFPVNQELIYWAGNAMFGASSFGPIRSYDGRTLRIVVSAADRETPVDFIILNPGSKMAWTLPTGVILPATPMPLPAVGGSSGSGPR